MLTAALTLAALVVLPVVSVWAYIKHVDEKSMKHIQWLGEQSRLYHEQAKHDGWYLGKMFLALRDGAEGNVISPFIKQIVEGYFDKHPYRPNYRPVDYWPDEYRKHWGRLADTLKTVGVHGEDKAWAKAYYDLKVGVSYHGCGCSRCSFGIDWTASKHPKLQFPQHIYDRVEADPEARTKAESEAYEYVQLALSTGTFNPHHLSYWVGKVTSSKDESINAQCYGIALWVRRIDSGCL